VVDIFKDDDDNDDDDVEPKNTRVEWNALLLLIDGVKAEVVDERVVQMNERRKIRIVLFSRGLFFTIPP
jgi:hypothetical protein